MTRQLFSNMLKTSCRPTQGHDSWGFRYFNSSIFYTLLNCFGLHILFFRSLNNSLFCDYRAPLMLQAHLSIWRWSWWRRVSTQIKSPTRSTFWMKKTRVMSHLPWTHLTWSPQARSKCKVFTWCIVTYQPPLMSSGVLRFYHIGSNVYFYFFSNFMFITIWLKSFFLCETELIQTVTSRCGPFWSIEAIVCVGAGHSACKQHISSCVIVDFLLSPSLGIHLRNIYLCFW